MVHVGTIRYRRRKMRAREKRSRSTEGMETFMFFGRREDKWTRRGRFVDVMVTYITALSVTDSVESADTSAFSYPLSISYPSCHRASYHCS